MSVPYSFCTKVQKKRNIWKAEKRYWRDNKKIVRAKRCRNNRGRSLQRPHTPFDVDTTVHKYSTIYGVSQG